MLTNIQLLNATEENIEWLNENYKNIQEEFEGQIIAIKNKKVVANAKNSETLLKVLKEKNIDEAEVLIEVISPKNEISIL